MSPRPFDAVVVGGGPAGLAAATWLGRYRRRTLLIDSGSYRNWCVEHAHGYLGGDPCSPEDLRTTARKELSKYSTVEVREGCVTAVRGSIDEFEIEIEIDDSGPPEVARRVVIATGVRDDFPEVGGFFDHYGADVFHCPSCDGYEARDRHVVVFGWTDRVTGFVLDLLHWAASATVVTDGHRFEGDGDDRAALAAAGVEVIEDDAVELVGARGALESVRLAGGRTLPCTMAFFSIAHRPITGLAEQLECALTVEGCLEVDDCCRTSVAGVYGAGDLTPGLQLIQVAAAKGTIAGVTCALSLAGKDAR